jgi:hypothetical protein
VKDLRSKALDRRDFSRMHGVLEKHGWANTTGASRYKHSTVPGTVILHTHSYGGAAWHHTGADSNRGVKTLMAHLEKIHGMREMTASAAIGSSGAVSDPSFDDENDDADVVKPAGGTGTGGDDSVSTGASDESRLESIEDVHVKMQRHYFSNVGLHKKQNETYANYVRIHPRDGSMEMVNIKFLPGDIDRWEHRHHGEIHKGSDAETLDQFLTRPVA